jgi:hypothetical protein
MSPLDEKREAETYRGEQGSNGRHLRTDGQDI